MHPNVVQLRDELLAMYAPASQQLGQTIGEVQSSSAARLAELAALQDEWLSCLAQGPCLEGALG